MLDDEGQDHGCVVTGDASFNYLTFQVCSVPVCVDNVERREINERCIKNGQKEERKEVKMGEQTDKAKNEEGIE